ncbi:MAG: nucleoside kinase [Lachnospiraceae bacterium]|nr:nucleoside kinase [Lachnospiraceae bacterium]
MEQIKITLEGKEYLVNKGITIEQLIDENISNAHDKYLLAFVDKKLSELGVILDRNCEIELVTKDSVMGVSTYKRSLTLLMLKAFRDVIGSKKQFSVNVVYSMGNGYFCKLQSEEITVSEKLLSDVKARMLEIVSKDWKITKSSVSTDEAIRRFAAQGMHDKEKLFKYRRVSKVNLYNLDGYEDYFYGYMVPSTGYLKVFDIIPYNTGFVLMAPDKDNKVSELKPQEKLFNVLKTSDEWSKTLDVANVGDLNEAITTGDIRELMLVQEALQEKQIAQIADMIMAGNKKIVLIAGPSSSGKTTFSHRLSVQLRAHGLRPYPLALDNYFVDRELTPKDENGNYDFECIEAMDLDLFNADMTKLLAGEEIEMPTFNFSLGKKEYKGKKLKLNKGDVLVAEGIHALNPLMTSKLPDESKFKVYISALTQINVDEHNRIPTTDGRLIRRIVRDARTRGNDAKDTIAMWPSVRRGEEKYIFPFQEEADVMFNSALIYELSVIKQFAEPLLFAVPRDSYEYYEAKRLLKFLDYFLGLDVTNVPKNSILREFVGGGCFDL